MPDSPAPVRIQRKRTKGWRMPEGAVYVGRPTKWGNPFDWREWIESWPFPSPTPHPWEDETNRTSWCRGQAAQEFADAVASGEIVLPVAELRGKTLVCWCSPTDYCHADVLLKLANAP